MATLNTELGTFTVKIEFDPDTEEALRRIVREEIAAARAEGVPSFGDDLEITFHNINI